MTEGAAAPHARRRGPPPAPPLRTDCIVRSRLAHSSTLLDLPRLLESKGAHGEVVGYLVQVMIQGSRHEQLGFRTGDVLTGINDLPLS